MSIDPAVNVELRRDQDGSLAVSCDGKRLHGVVGISVVQGDAGHVAVLTIPMAKVRLVESGPRPMHALTANGIFSPSG